MSENKKLLKDLDKFKMGAACIYFKKLSDINLTAMEKIAKNTITHYKKKYSKG